jgi:hypothetical protein
MQILLIFIAFIFHYCFYSVYAQTNVVHWIPDNIDYQIFSRPTNFSDHSLSNDTQHYQISITSNGPLSDFNSESDSGYRLVFHFRELSDSVSSSSLSHLFGESSCIAPSSTADEVISLLQMTEVGFSLNRTNDNNPLQYSTVASLSSFFDIHVIKNYQQNITTEVYSTLYQLQFTPLSMFQTHSDFNLTILSLSLSTSSCSPVHTIGKWDDRYRWQEGRVPTANDNVIIPVGAGTIIIERNITIQSLIINDGELILSKSSCPSGWTSDNRYSHR